MKKKISLMLAFALLLTPIQGSSLSNKKDELSSTKQNIADAKKELANNNDKIETIQAEIKKVDLQIVSITDKIDALESQIKTKEEAIAKKQVELDEMNVKKEEQYEDTKARMCTMYKNQKIGYLQVIFSSSSFWEAINRIEYIKRISDRDNKVLDEYKATIASIEETKNAIETEKQELEEIQNEQISKKSELEKAKGNKDSALAELKAEENKIKSEIEQLQEDSNRLEKEIKKLLAQQAASSNSSSGNKYSTNTTYSGGTFAWPVPGYYRISSEYNPRTSPISGKYEFHTGIDIPASYGENVVAAADGVIITSGWIRGYGNTIMINHGGGLVTLYGHNSSLVASVGQTVTKGQTVAKIGSTGYSTGNHCHFEVRVNGSHTSPWNYLSK